MLRIPPPRTLPRALAVMVLALISGALGMAPTQAGPAPDASRFRITSVAGAGLCDGHPATEVAIFPQSMAVGPQGEVAFVDNGAGTTVRVIDETGNVRTVAWVPPASGQSRLGEPADLPGIPRLKSLASFPLAFDASGRLLILDRNARRLYALEDGSLVPLVGNGEGDGAGDGGAPLEASLRDPIAVSTDADGNIYITDADPVSGQSSIRYVNRSESPRVFFPGTARELTVQANTIRKIHTEVPEAQDGVTEQYSLVGRVFPDAKGNLFFAVSYFNTTAQGSQFDPKFFQERIRVLNTTGTTHTLNGWEVPAGSTVTIAGADANTNQVREGVPARAYVVNPLFSEAVAVDDAGNVYFPMFGRAKIMKIDTAGIITTFVGEDPESSAYGKPTGSYPEIYGDGNYTPPGRDHSVTAVSGPLDVAIGPDRSTLYYVGGKEFDIRKVEPGGTVRQVAGNSLWRYCGDGGPAAPQNPLYGPKLANNTMVDGPRAVADSDGNIYIADVSNNVVRRVSPDGVISTLVGHPKPCTTGVGYGTTFPLACPGGFSGDGGPAAQAELSFPMSIALDDNGLFIADKGNAAVRYVNLSDHSVRVVGIDVAPGTIETVAGGSFPVVSNETPPQARFKLGPICNNGINYNFDRPLQEMQTARDAQICPNAVAVAPNGDLFVLDGFTHGSLYRVDSQNRMTQIAGRSPDAQYSLGDGQEALDYDYCPSSGQADRTPLCLPYDLTVDHLGNVYVLQANSSVIYASTTQGSMVMYINLRDEPVTVHGVAVAPGEMRRVVGRRGVTPTACQASTGDGGPALDATFCSIGGAAVRGEELFLSDSWNAKLRVVDADGIIHSFAGGPGAVLGPGGMPNPFTGAYAGDGGLARDARFLLPAKTSIPLSGGYLLVSDSGNYRIRMVVDCADPAYSETELCTAALPTQGEGAGGGQALESGQDAWTWSFTASAESNETSAHWGPTFSYGS